MQKILNTLSLIVATKVVEHPLKLLLGCLIAATILLAGTFFLSFDSNYKIFIDEENAYRKSLEKLESSYLNNEESVVFVVADKNGDAFNASTFKAVQELTQKAASLPYSMEVESFSNFQRVSYSNDELSVTDLLPTDVALDEAFVANTKAYVNNTVGMKGYLSSLRDDALVVVVYFNLDGNRTKLIQDIANESRIIKQQIISNYPNTEIYLSGLLMFDQAMLDAIVGDAEFLLPVAAILIFLVIAYVFQSIWVACLILTVVNISIASTFGAAGWWGYNVNTLTFSAILIISTLSVADSVHLVSNYVKNLHSDQAPNDALKNSIRVNFTAITLTTFTTSIGFLALNFSASPPVRQLGLFTSVGVWFAYVCSIGVLPWCLLRLSKHFQSHKLTKVFYTKRIVDFVMKFHKQILIVGGVLSLLAIAPIIQNRLNDDALKWFAKDMEFRQAIDYSDGRLSGLRTIAYSFDSSHENGVIKEDFIKEMEKMSLWLDQQEDVIEVRSYLDILKNINNQEMGENQLSYNDTINAQYLLMYELSVPSWRGTGKYLTNDKREAKLIISTKNLSNTELITFEHGVSSWIDENLTYKTTKGASVPLMFVHIAQENLYGMLIGTSIALLAITLILVFALGSVRLGLLSLLPNLTPILVVYGVWGLYSSELNLAAVTMFSIALGVVVDDSIHVLSKYRMSILQGNSKREAVTYSLNSTGSAIIITTLILCIGFFIVGFSNFKLSAVQGSLVGFALLFAVVFDLTVLPSLLLGGNKDAKNTS